MPTKVLKVSMKMNNANRNTNVQNKKIHIEWTVDEKHRKTHGATKNHYLRHIQKREAITTLCTECISHIGLLASFIT